MPQLTAAVARTFVLGDLTDHAVKATSAIFEGSAVGLTAGFARQLNAGDIFVGFATEDVPSVAADGGANVQVRARGTVLLTVSSVAVTDIGKPVYASDGDTFTLTQSTNSFIGRVLRVAATNTAEVEFDARRGGLGLLTVLTDSSGGTASDTIADVPGTYTEATLANQIASLAAKINAIIRQISN